MRVLGPWGGPGALCQGSMSIMPKLVHVLGSILLWLVTASGIAWWVVTAFQVYEIEWALLACAVILISVLFAAYLLQRIWTWFWLTSNARKAAARRLSPENDAVRRHPADGEAIDRKWRDKLDPRDE